MLSFKLQQEALHVQSGGISRQTAPTADYPVTRHDDQERIPVVGHSDGPHGFRIADSDGHLPVRTGLAVRNLPEHLPHGTLKGSSVHLQRKRKLTAAYP